MLREQNQGCTMFAFSGLSLLASDTYPWHPPAFKVSCQRDIMIPKYFRDDNLLCNHNATVTPTKVNHSTITTNVQDIFKFSWLSPKDSYAISPRDLKVCGFHLEVNLENLPTLTSAWVWLMTLTFEESRPGNLQKVAFFVCLIVSQSCPFTFKPAFPLKRKLGLEAWLSVGSRFFCKNISEVPHEEVNMLGVPTTSDTKGDG